MIWMTNPARKNGSPKRSNLNTSTSPTGVFDRDLLRTRKKRCAGSFENHRFLHDLVRGRLQERLQDINRDFNTGIVFSDQPDPWPPYYRSSFISATKPDLIADEEFLPFAHESVDIILSILEIQNINDMPGALIQMRRALKPDGLFLAAMIGGESLHELRSCLTEAELALDGGISPRVHPFADKQQAGALLQRAGFALPVVDSELVTVTYESMTALMHDLRGMGMGNITHDRRRKPATRALFDTAQDLYFRQFAEHDKRLRATFEIIYMIGWAPHESQQKPLKPGSAEKSLAETLKTKEIKTGDFTGRKK